MVVAALASGVHDVSVRDRAAYLADPDALVLADLHLGRAAASAVEFPLRERADIQRRVLALVDAFDPGALVFAGDLLHRFDGARREGADIRALAGACAEAGPEPVLVAGNHDTALADAWDGPVRDAYRLDDGTLVCHGHEEPAADAPRYVVGHDHPVLEVEGVRRPCFLYGPDTFRGGDVLMLPAFTTLAPGVVVNRYRADDFDSPLVTDADALRPLVWTGGDGGDGAGTGDGDAGGAGTVTGEAGADGTGDAGTVTGETGADGTGDGVAGETLTFPPLGAFRDML